jgi:hypothetical protein
MGWMLDPWWRPSTVWFWVILEPCVGESVATTLLDMTQGFTTTVPPLARSYADPVRTWETNVMGTVHVLEALCSSDNLCAVVVVTTDMVYDNREWLHA